MPKAGKKSLRAALLNQQTRLDKKQQAARAAEHGVKISQTKGKGSSKAKSKGKEKAAAPGPIIPFHLTDKILLIGEGNFSFAAALFAHPALQHLPPSSVTATAYDSENGCVEKYSDAEANIRQLRERGAEVLFNVNATCLEKCKALRGRRWDRVVWNFPHAGKGITDQDRNILSNQLMLLGFLRSVKPLLSEGPIPKVNVGRRRRRNDDDSSDDDAARHPRPADGDDGGDDNEHDTDMSMMADQKQASRGTVLVTLRNVNPYTEWNISGLAKKPPPPQPPSTLQNPVYIQLRSFAFVRSCWPGYEHRMTKGERAHGTGTTGSTGEDRTWEFCLRDEW